MNLTLEELIKDLPLGLFWPGDCLALAEIASTVPPNGVIIEIGSFLGRSSAILAKTCPTASIICIDPWYEYPNGNPEWSDEMAKQALNSYESFLINTKQYKNISHIRGHSPLDNWHEYDAKVDLVFIDANHDNPHVSNDIRFAKRLIKQGGIICGHDYNEHFPDVVSAVTSFAASTGTTAMVYPNSAVWRIKNG